MKDTVEAKLARAGELLDEQPIILKNRLVAWVDGSGTAKIVNENGEDVTLTTEEGGKNE